MSKKTFLGIALFGLLVPLSISAQERAISAQEERKLFSNTASYPVTGESFLTAGLAVGDIDGDGDLDLIEGNGRHWAQTNYVYFNAANSRRLSSRMRLDTMDRTSYTTKLADLDNDGDLDIIQASDKMRNQIFYNDGKGNYSEAKFFGDILSNTRSIQIVDINGDGHLDILEICRGSANLIFLNDSVGHFPTMDGNHGDDFAIPFGELTDSTLDVAVADMNGDGHVDLVLANRDQQQNKILLGNGKIEFTSAINFGSGKDDTRGVAVADMNGDGHLDVITANIGEANSVILNNGDGTFKDPQTFGDEKGRSYAVVAHDLDGDGDMDIVIGNVAGTNNVYLNNGKGGLTLNAKLGLEKARTYAIAVGDMNGDKRPDIISGNSEEKNIIFYQIRPRN
jgi:hypothetical protein